MGKYTANLYQVDGTQLNEDLKTVAHNLLTRTFLDPHALNLKHWGTFVSFGTLNLLGIFTHLFNATDKVDQAYFKSMYRIDQSLQAKLKSIIRSKYADAVLVGTKGVKANSTGHIGNMDTGYGFGGLASRHTRKATADFGSGMLTTSTCFYKLMDEGGKYYILYFTFDGDGIKNCKILCKKQNADPNEYDSYYVKDMVEFNRINSEEYKK